MWPEISLERSPALGQKLCIHGHSCTLSPTGGAGAAAAPQTSSPVVAIGTLRGRVPLAAGVAHGFSPDAAESRRFATLSVPARCLSQGPSSAHFPAGGIDRSQSTWNLQCPRLPAHSRKRARAAGHPDLPRKYPSHRAHRLFPGLFPAHSPPVGGGESPRTLTPQNLPCLRAASL